MNIYKTNSYLLIRTDRLLGNVRAIQSRLNGAKLIPVLKGDAYGLGLVPVAKVLADEGLDTFAVAHVGEGLTLRQALADEGCTPEILVMGAPLPFHLDAAVRAGLTLTLCRPGLAAQLGERSDACGVPVRVQIKLDTGLHRLGFLPGEETDELIRELREAGDRLKVTGVYSHFADTEDAPRTAAQAALFRQGVTQLRAAGITAPLYHIAASASHELYPEYHFDAVRIGRGLYWDHPTRPLGDITEVCAWRSWVTAVHARHAGEALGYGSGVRPEHDTLVAVIGVGYGDGMHPGMAERHAPVLIRGQRCPVLVCCMDQSLVDVTVLCGAGWEQAAFSDAASCDAAARDALPVQVGDEVTLLGWDADGVPLPAQPLALSIGADEACALTNALTNRVTRIYRDGE